MAIGGDLTTEQRLRRVERLLQTAEEAYMMARHLNSELHALREWETGGRVTPVAYSLGICLGDVETAANRLGGLRNELQVLARQLEEQ